MPNQVKLTFAGETQDIEQAFGRVDESSKKMNHSVDESARGFHRAGEAADEIDTKAMGFRDTLTGVQDTAKGTSQIMKGDLFNGMLTLGMGIGDLASGFYNLIIPALAQTKIATVAQTIASKAAAIGTKIWAAAQWIMNASMYGFPLVWIIAAIVAVIAIIVVIAKKTDWFSRAWAASWKWIKSAASNTWDFLKKIPGWLASAFSRVTNAITAPFRAAFNGIARAWNSTVGRLSWSVPGWVPFIGGNSISVPNLPTFHTGGVVPGNPGQSVLAVLQGGERVSSTASRSGQTVVVSDGPIVRMVIDAIASEVRKRGGRLEDLGLKAA